MKLKTIDWTGPLPSSWDVKRLKDVAAVGAGDPAPPPEFLVDKKDGIPFLRVSDLEKRCGFHFGQVKDYVSIEYSRRLNHWAKGTIVFPKSGESIRTNVRAILGEQMAVVSHLACISSLPIIDYKYLFWVLSAVDFESSINQTAIPALNLSVIKNYEIPFPSVAEQCAISDFLDKKTFLIDQKIALISRKQGLLAELRKATIHDAVTRGVANGQPLKASGIKWIDDIPTSWTVKRLKEISKFESGWTPESKNQEYYGGDIPWATIGDLPKSRVINETKNKISSSAVDKFNMRPIAAGTLLFSFKLSIGQVAFTGCEMFTNEAIAAFRELSISKDFAYYAFPVFVTKNCKENIYGAPLLNRELMLNSFIPIPSTEEQKDIVQYLDREIHRIDQMASLAKRQIELLQEQRKALIHEVVTGKMRVI